MTTPMIPMNKINTLRKQDLAVPFVLALTILTFTLPTSVVYSGEGSNHGHHALLSGDRDILGTVLEVRSGQYKVDTGPGQSRFLPMNVRKAKGLPDLKKGDQITISLNDQNLIVDVHLVGEASHHRIIEGQLAQPLITGHGKAVVRTKDGQDAPHFIRPLARSKVASIPVGVDALFLIDEIDTIVDVTFASKEAVNLASHVGDKKTPLKGNFPRITGVIVASLSNDKVSIRMANGQEKQYEVRPLIQKKVKKLSLGQTAVLFIDEEEKVTDVSSL